MVPTMAAMISARRTTDASKASRKIDGISALVDMVETDIENLIGKRGRTRTAVV